MKNNQSEPAEPIEHRRQWTWFIPLAVSILTLVVGASFHGYRIHPENVHKFHIGVAMGITMASIAAVSFVTCVILYLKDRKRQK